MRVWTLVKRVPIIADNIESAQRLMYFGIVYSISRRASVKVWSS